MGTLNVSSRSYPVGVRSFSIPQSKLDFESYEIALTRENWPAGVDCILDDGKVQSNVAVQIVFERSDDGGASWKPAGGATFPGGVLIGRDGQPIAQSSISFSAKEPLTGARVKQTGTLRVTARVLVPIATAVTVSALEAA